MSFDQQLDKYLLQCLEDALDGEKATTNSDFAALGLDSISVFSFTSQLKEIIPTIPLTIFLECKNISELKKYLYKNHQDELEQYFLHK